MGIKENLDKIIDMKNRAALDAGRTPQDILLCAVTKTRSSDEINEAIRCGVTDIGENKVQEIVDKYDKILPVKWHLIGHLQTNKVKYIIDKIDMIHSCDSFRLAEEIDKRCAKAGRSMDVLIQVNIAGEEQKFGVSKLEAEDLIHKILDNCPNIKIKGLMFIAPFAEDPESISKYFAEVKKLYDELGKTEHINCDFNYLSMGMSGDFPVAIREGSNLIRVGTAIFGERNYNNF